MKKNLLHTLLFVLIANYSIFSLQAQAVIQSVNTSKGDSNDNPKINKPSGIAAGDLLIINIMFEKGVDETITAPFGWALILRTNNGMDCGIATYYKIATGGESSSYSFGFTNGSKWCMGITHITGANTSFPIGIASGAAGNGTATSAPSLTTNDDNTLVLCYYTNKKDATFTPAAGTIEKFDDPNSPEGLPSNMMAYFVQATAGASGDKTATSSETERWAAQQIPIGSSILPVGFLSFQAINCQTSNICLNWSTAFELNNDHFAIERSTDANNWKVIEEIKGAGNSSTHINYSAIDPHPNPGKNYYRIKQIDFDGKFSYSNTQLVYFLQSEDIHIYPNPTTGQITLEGELEEIRQIQLYNSLGQEVSSSINIKESNSFQVMLDLTNLVDGIYLLKTKNNFNKIYIKE